MRIAVIGGGHGGYAAAVDLKRRGHVVRLFTSDRNRAERLAASGKRIMYDGVWGRGSVELDCVTADMQTALSDVELVMMNIPGTWHEKYFTAMQPYLREDTILYLNPGHSGGALRAARLLHRGRIAEANTLSYIARKKSENEVYVSSADKPVTVGIFPASDTKSCMEVIRKVYPQIRTAEHVIESSLCNINALLHPPGVLLNAGWIEHTKGAFKFYYEGITPAVANVIAALDRERLQAAEAYGIRMTPFSAVFFEAGSTTKEAAESGDLHRVCQESEANRFIDASDTLDHRYMHEDICSGLLPIAELGHLAGVKMPLMDAMVTMAGALMQRNYRKEGVNLEKMGLCGMNAEQALQYVKTGEREGEIR